MELASAIIGILGVVAAIIFGYLAFRRGQKSDDRTEQKELTEMQTTLGFIKNSVTRIENNQQAQSVTIAGLSERVTRVEESTKQAHKRIDSLEKTA